MSKEAEGGTAGKNKRRGLSMVPYEEHLLELGPQRSRYHKSTSYAHSDAREWVTMKTVQMTLDDELVSAVDQTVRRLGTTRSAFTRDALRAALNRVRVRELEHKHRKGYARKPVRKHEFLVWEQEQVWAD